jgi:thiol:disulfide interchange protein DsbC
MKIAACLGALAVGLFASSVVLAQTPEANIRKALATKIPPSAKIESVVKTPYSGLYEVRIGSDVLYTDEKAQYVFQGNVIDLASGRNFTRERSEQFQAELDKVFQPMLFSDETLKTAMKLVKGNGKRKMIVFEDPNCGYCKKLRQSLEEMTDITVYTVMIPILAEDSKKKAHDLWCAPDRQKAYDDWMLRGKLPVAAAKTCEDPQDKALELSQSLRVTGTPAIFLADGTRLPGYMSAPDLEKRLASVKN